MVRTVPDHQRIVITGLGLTAPKNYTALVHDLKTLNTKFEVAQANSAAAIVGHRNADRQSDHISPGSG